MESNFDARVRVELRLQAKANAAKLVQALLEARQDLTVHKLMAMELEPAMLEMMRNYVTTILEDIEAKGSAEDGNEDKERYEVERFVFVRIY